MNNTDDLTALRIYLQDRDPAYDSPDGDSPDGDCVGMVVWCDTELHAYRIIDALDDAALAAAYVDVMGGRLAIVIPG